MSKTLLIIGGSVGGAAVVAGGAATGIVISQQNANTETTNEVLTNIKTQIENNNKLDKNVSATSIYPNGTGTKLSADQLSALGLEATFEGYTVGVTVDAVSETEVTFNVTLNKTGEAEQTIKVSLFGFKATDATEVAFNALVAAVEGKTFAVNDSTEYVQTFALSLSDKSFAEQLALVLAKNDSLNAQKSDFDKFATALTSQVSTTSTDTALAVTVTLKNGSTEKQVTFSLNGFVNGETALRSKAAAVAGDYAVLNSVSTKEFVEAANLATLASLVNGLSEKLTENGVTLASVTAESVLDTATVVVFKVRLNLTTTNLETETTISVTGLKAVTEIAEEEAKAELAKVVSEVNGQSYSVKDTTTSVKEFIAEAAPGTIASLIDGSFKSALGNVEVSEITVTAQASNPNAVTVAATLKIGSATEAVTFNVTSLVSNSLADANASLEAVATAINGKTFEAVESTYAEAFVKSVNVENLVEKLGENFATALSGATINTVNARVATETDQATVELVLGYSGTDATKAVSITVDNLQTTPTEAQQLATLISALQGSEYTVKTASTTTKDFADTVSTSNLVELVDGLDSKLAGLTVTGLTKGDYNAASTSLVLTLTVTLEGSEVSGTASITVNGLTSTDQVDKDKETAELEKVVAAINDQTFQVSDSSKSVSEFIAQATISNITTLVNNLQSALGTNGKITELEISANTDNQNEVNVVATVGVGTSTQSVSFKVNGLVANATVAANTTLDKVATSLGGSTFNAKTNVEADVFANTVTKENIKTLLGDSFTNDLSTASIDVLTAKVTGTSRNQVQISLTLGHAETSVTKEVVITVANLSSAPESDTAQAALDKIVANVNNQTFATKEQMSNVAFINRLTEKNLSSLLADTFANAISGASVAGIVGHEEYDSATATEVTLTITLSYPQANNREVTIKVSNLVSPQTASNQSAQKLAQNMADQWSNRSVPVDSNFTGLNTNAYQNALKSDFANSLPAAILTSFGSATVSLKSASFVPITGTTLSVSLSVVAYSGGPEITVNNLTLTGLVPFGVTNGNAYLTTALETSATQALDKWSNVVPMTYDSLTADRFESTILLKNGSTPANKLNAIKSVLNLKDQQVNAIQNFTLSVPSLISTTSKSYDFVIEYSGNVGTLYLVLAADTTGPTWTDGNETDIRYESSIKVSLSKFISFKAGHYQDLGELVEEANNENYVLSNRRNAQEWIDYFTPSWKRANYNAITMLSWMADDTGNYTLKQIYWKTKRAEINAFTINSEYSFTLTATLYDNLGVGHKLNITFNSEVPKFTVINTGLNLMNNYDLTFLFSRNLQTKQEKLASVIETHGGSRSAYATKIREFANLETITYRAESDTSTDTIIFTLTSTSGSTYEIALKFNDLKVAPVKSWMETAENAQFFELITSVKWIRTQMVVAPSTDTSRLTWVQGQDYLIKLFFYRNDDTIDVSRLFNQTNGVVKVQLKPYTKNYIENVGNKFSIAHFTFNVTGFDGTKYTAFESDYIVQYYDAYFYGGANWNNQNWDQSVPSSALYNVYADLLVNGISVGWL